MSKPLITFAFKRNVVVEQVYHIAGHDEELARRRLLRDIKASKAQPIFTSTIRTGKLHKDES